MSINKPDFLEVKLNLKSRVITKTLINKPILQNATIFQYFET